MAFADEFIQGYTTGQQTRRQQQDRQREEMRMQFEVQDRDVNKQLLQHKLKEIKIQEQIQARDAALQNLEALEGTDVMDLTPDQTEGGVIPAVSPMNPLSIRTQMAPMQIPGIEELNVPGITKRPKTMQDQLATVIANKRQLDENTIQEVSPGASQMRAGTVLGTAPDREGYVKVTERDANGVATDRWVPKREIGDTTATREPLPSQQLSDGSDLDEITAGIFEGTISPDLTGYKGGDRVKITAALRKTGFNLREAQQDQLAVNRHIGAMNTADIGNLKIAANGVNAALADLKALNEAWDRTSWGPLNFANLAIIKARGGTGADQAKELEGAIDAVREGIGILRAAGGQPSNRTLDEVATILDPSKSKGDLQKEIARLETRVKYRTNAILNAEPTMPRSTGSAAGSGKTITKTDAEISAALKAAGYNPTPERIKTAKESQDLLRQLFPE